MTLDLGWVAFITLVAWFIGTGCGMAAEEYHNRHHGGKTHDHIT